MNIHEYQAKAVLKEFGVPVSKGVPVLDAAQAEAAAIKDVRNVATDLAIAASHHLAAEASKGAKGADLIASSIEAVKNRLN